MAIDDDRSGNGSWEAERIAEQVAVVVIQMWMKVHANKKSLLSNWFFSQKLRLRMDRSFNAEQLHALPQQNHAVAGIQGP